MASRWISALRDLAGENEKAGRPWEKAKGFDNACPISGFIPAAEFHGDPQNTSLSLKINGEVRQQGTTADMIHRIVPLIAYMSRFFTLKAGDVDPHRHPGRRGAAAQR